MNKGNRLDYFGEDASRLGQKKLFLFDMDGTIYIGNTLIDGTLALLDDIRSHDGRYIFITNNSSRSVADYLKKVHGMAIPAGEEDFFTSSQAAIYYLKRDHPGKRVYCQGTRSLVAELKKAGIDTVEEIESGIGVVLVGFDTELTYHKLCNTCEILNKNPGIPFVATNPDWVCPVEGGSIPDCGSMCQLIKGATGCYPRFLGKPEPTMIRLVMEKYGCSPEETMVIGDRIYTDIEAGLRAGVDSVCVLSGECTLADIEQSERKPTFTFDSVREILDCIRAARGE